MHRSVRADCCRIFSTILGFHFFFQFHACIVCVHAYTCVHMHVPHGVHIELKTKQKTKSCVSLFSPSTYLVFGLGGQGLYPVSLSDFDHPLITRWEFLEPVALAARFACSLAGYIRLDTCSSCICETRWPGVLMLQLSTPLRPGSRGAVQA